MALSPKQTKKEQKWDRAVEAKLSEKGISLFDDPEIIKGAFEDCAQPQACTQTALKLRFKAIKDNNHA